MTDQGNCEADNVGTWSIDIAAGLFLAAMSIVALTWVIPNNVETGTGEYDVGPAFFPRLAAFAVLGFSLTLVIANAVRYRKGKVGISGAFIVVEFVLWAVVSIVALLGLSWFGFLFIAPLLVGLGAVVGGYRTWWVIGLLAVAFPVAIDQLAWLVFTVDLP